MLRDTNELNTPCKFLLFSELLFSFNFCRNKPDSLLPLAFRKLIVWTELSISNRFSRAFGTRFQRRFMEYQVRELNIGKIKRQFCVRILIICDKRSLEVFQFRSQGRSTETWNTWNQLRRVSVFKWRFSPRQVELFCEFIVQTVRSIGRHFSSVTLKNLTTFFWNTWRFTFWWVLCTSLERRIHFFMKILKWLKANQAFRMLLHRSPLQTSPRHLPDFFSQTRLRMNGFKGIFHP